MPVPPLPSIIIFALSALSIVAVALLLRIRQRHRNMELRYAESEKRIKLQAQQLAELGKELQHKDKDLSQFALHLSLCQEMVEHVGQELRAVSKQAQPSVAQSLNSLQRKIVTDLQAEQRLTTMRSNVEQLNNAFFARLAQRFPDLTPAEKELCGMIRMDLSGKEIATLRNIDPQSVRKSRQRLRKKLQLDRKADVYSFIQEI